MLCRFVEESQIGLKSFLFAPDARHHHLSCQAQKFQATRQTNERTNKWPQRETPKLSCCLGRGIREGELRKLWQLWALQGRLRSLWEVSGRSFGGSGIWELCALQGLRRVLGSNDCNASELKRKSSDRMSILRGAMSMSLEPCGVSHVA